MGRNHCRSGVIAGVALAALMPGAPLPVMALTIVVTGGAALVPDIDHPGATAARSLGRITKWIARGVSAIALEVYHASREGGDPPTRASGHRLLTHTLVGALLYGVCVALLCLAHPLAGGVAVLLLARLLGIVLKGVGGVFSLLSGGVGVWVLYQESAWWWAIPLAATVGCVVHILGDTVTNSGTPLLWPLLRGGRRWGPVRTPVTFSAGDSFEHAVVAPLLLVGVCVAPLALAFIVFNFHPLFTTGGA